MPKTSPIKHLAISFANEYLQSKHPNSSFNSHHLESIVESAFIELQKKPHILLRDHVITLTDDHKQELQKVIDSLLLSGKTPWKSHPQLENDIQKLFFNLIRGNDISKTERPIKLSTLAKAIVWKSNPKLLEEARKMVNTIFVHMMTDLETISLDAKEERFHMEMIIGDLLSLYPFLNPQESEELQIPLCDKEGKWKLISYHVNNIALTPAWMGSPLMAIGLIPQDILNSPPLLLFKGTTYPTDHGFSLSLITDINPIASVGSYAFKSARKKIRTWLEEHTKHYSVIVYGKSLGGAQAWRTAMYFPDKVSHVMAYGAPGLSLRDQRRWEKLEASSRAPEVHMFCQKGDDVPYFNRPGTKAFTYYEILGNKAKNGFLAHALMYSTHVDSAIIKMSASQISKKWKRIGLTLWKDILSFLVFPILILGHAIQTSVKKVIRLIRKVLKCKSKA